jgi:protein gp37
MNPAWVIDLRDQCRRAEVPFFFKQWGGKNKKQAGRVLEQRIWNEMPQHSKRKKDLPILA